MGIPKEPRQQMINMMYLFLTAMLALNVSAEILRAFSIVNSSLEKSSETIKDKNEVIMIQFDKKMQEDPDKTREFYDKAKQVVAYSKELSEHIFGIKTLLIDNAGNKNGVIDTLGDYEEMREPGILRVKNESNLDMSSQTLVANQGAKRGEELKEKINEIRAKLLAVVEDGMSESAFADYVKNFPLLEAKDTKLEGGLTKSWQQSNFGDVPLAAAITLLSKYESDVQNAEAEILQFLINSISAADFKFDVIKPIVIPSSRYVMQGGEYHAEIFTAAMSSTQDPIIIIGDVDSLGNITGDDTTMLGIEGGIGNYVVPATGVGAQSYRGVIKLKNPAGEGYQVFPFKQEWNVMVGQAVVSPTKMNVLYIGVDNPLAISAAGFTADKVKPSCAGCALRPDKKKGDYLARVSKQGKAIVTVGAEMEDGTTKKVGAQEFRVKRVPDPIATLGKKYTGGKIQSHILKAQRGVVADLRDFVFDLRFNVVSFEMTYAAKGSDLIKLQAKGPALSTQMVNVIKRAKKGDLVFFDEVKVRGPDKIPRKLQGIAFEVM